MDRIWQWAWDRYGARRYVWALALAAFVVSLPIYLVFVSLPIVVFEKSPGGVWFDLTLPALPAA